MRLVELNATLLATAEKPDEPKAKMAKSPKKKPKNAKANEIKPSPGSSKRKPIALEDQAKVVKPSARKQDDPITDEEKVGVLFLSNKGYSIRQIALYFNFESTNVSRIKVAEAMRLFAEGKSLEDIAKTIPMKLDTVIKHCKVNG